MLSVTLLCYYLHANQQQFKQFKGSKFGAYSKQVRLEKLSDLRDSFSEFFWLIRQFYGLDAPELGRTGNPAGCVNGRALASTRAALDAFN